MQDLFIVIFFIAAFVLFFILVSKIFTLEDILLLYIAASGGKERMDTIDRILMEGVQEHSSGTAIRFKIKKIKGRLYQIVYQTGRDYSGIIIKGSKGWFFSADTYELTAMTYKQIQERKVDVEIFGPLHHYKSKGYKLFYEGKEWVSDKLCYRIRLRSKDANAGFYFIDTDTNLLLERRTQSISDPGSLAGTYEIVQQYSAYKSIEGILFPMIITLKSIRDSFTWHFDKIALNVENDEDEYDKLT